MQLHHNINDLVHHGTPDIALTFGNFDGVHRGHQDMLKSLKEYSEKKNSALAVMTFTPHPRKILSSDSERFLIGNYQQRRHWLEELGVEHLIEIPFTRDFSTLGPEAFLGQHVISYPGLRSVHLGWDFAFGSNKTGEANLVKTLCSPLSIEVQVCNAFALKENTVSSTAIRKALLSGDVMSARDMLGRDFSVSGVVVRGEGRGRKIGVPTANLQLDPDLLIPLRGVYITESMFRGIAYRSVTNIGFNPTFQDEKSLTVETHLIDFMGDLYGETIEVRFLGRIRDEKKFSNVNDLIEQLKADINVGRKHTRT
jgi:riboflavin kinase/FMN adenylyltransferase